jgi:predicted RNase H-like HicB family nuclease
LVGTPLRFDILGASRVELQLEASEGERMTLRTLTAVIHREKDLFVAECPEVGTVSQSTSIEGAIANLKEAIELYLEEFPISEIGRSLVTTFEVTHA